MNPYNNTNPFGTGPDYFESFQAKLGGRIEAYEELKNEAPLLSSIPRYNPFEVPAHYFDELPTLIQEKCAAPEKVSAFEWLKMLFRPNFAVPVLTVIVVAVAGIRYLDQGIQGSSPVAEEISVEEQLQAIDESTIIEALASASVNESEADYENENIKEYLLDNHIEDINLNTEL